MSTSTPDIGVVIAAGGSGNRVGTAQPKQFRMIAGVPMLLRAIRPFASHIRVREIVVSLVPSAVTNPPDWLEELVGDRLRLVAGRATRGASVAAGVDALSSECHAVLIHDAARPFVCHDTVQAIVERLSHGASAIAAVPVADTIKRSAPGGRHVVETVAREGLWRAQTPQGFPRGTLEKAYQAAGDEGHLATDEAALVEAAGFRVELVKDSPTNIKVTTAEDFVIADALAAR